MNTNLFTKKTTNIMKKSTKPIKRIEFLSKLMNSIAAICLVIFESFVIFFFNHCKPKGYLLAKKNPLIKSIKSEMFSSSSTRKKKIVIFYASFVITTWLA